MKGLGLSYFPSCKHIIGEVMDMKFEIKIIILSVLFSICCMFLFTYACSFGQKTIYAYQVGIYKEEANKDAKLKELKEIGDEGYCYQKDKQYYVLSLMSEDRKTIEEHATKVKGIVKTYHVSSDMTPQLLLENLEKGVTYD